MGLFGPSGAELDRVRSAIKDLREYPWSYVHKQPLGEYIENISKGEARTALLEALDRIERLSNGIEKLAELLGYKWQTKTKEEGWVKVKKNKKAF